MPYDRNRRSFLKTSAGLLASSLMGGQFLIYPEDPVEKRYAFRPYRPGKGPASVVCVTPDDGYYLHTFFDICPWSVSGRYFAVTKLPYQKKKPLWGDVAEVCVIDLQKQTIRTVYRTKAWGFQLGAHLQWSHESDRYLYTNDIIGGKAVCVRVDLKDNSARAYAGAMYDLAPDDGCVISPNLLNMNIHQYGYAVPDGPTGKPVPFTAADMEKEGLWKTYNKSKKLYEECNYDMGFKQGICKTYYYKENVKTISSYDRDVLQTETFYSMNNDELFSGTIRVYWDNLLLSEEILVTNGKRNGKTKVYTEDGILDQELEYVDGVIHQ